jgi:hypothetical protein
LSNNRPASPKNSLHVRAPRSLTSAIRDAAERELMSPSEYIRRALVEKLRADGIDPAAYPPKSARAEDPDDDCPPDDQTPNPEAVGFIETDKINPDMILASVEAAPEVREAGTRSGDEAATAQALTRDFSERYRELGAKVLAFCLSTYQHGNIDGLKRAAGVG